MDKRYYWVEVEVACNEGNEYDWYKVSAVSEKVAKAEVIIWCKNNGCWFDGYTQITQVRDSAPMLITEIN